MKRVIAVAILMVLLGLVLACVPSYKEVLEEQAKTDNVIPVTLEEASAIQDSEPVVTFVIKDNGISVDKVVNIGKFYGGAEADIVYLIRNESMWEITPRIRYTKGTRIDDYSVVEGQGYVDAPYYVEQWITITPTPYPMKSNSAQGYIVALTMPEDAVGVPDKFAFQIGVAVGGNMQIAASPWWLIQLR